MYIEFSKADRFLCCEGVFYQKKIPSGDSLDLTGKIDLGDMRDGRDVGRADDSGRRNSRSLTDVNDGIETKQIGDELENMWGNPDPGGERLEEDFDLIDNNDPCNDGGGVVITVRALTERQSMFDMETGNSDGMGNQKMCGGSVLGKSHGSANQAEALEVALNDLNEESEGSDSGEGDIWSSRSKNRDEFHEVLSWDSWGDDIQQYKDADPIATRANGAESVQQRRTTRGMERSRDSEILDDMLNGATPNYRSVDFWMNDETPLARQRSSMGANSLSTQYLSRQEKTKYSGTPEHLSGLLSQVRRKAYLMIIFLR